MYKLEFIILGVVRMWKPEVNLGCHPLCGVCYLAWLLKWGLGLLIDLADWPVNSVRDALDFSFL